MFAPECPSETAPSSITCLSSCIPAVASQTKLLNKPEDLLTSARLIIQYVRHLVGVYWPKVPWVQVTLALWNFKDFSVTEAFSLQRMCIVPVEFELNVFCFSVL